MNRYFSLLRRFAVLICLLLSASGVLAQEAETPEVNVHVDNVAALQRGAKLFFNYCSGCHSLKFMRYSRIASDLHLSDAEVMKNLVFTGVKVGEPAVANMPPAKAKQFFGKAPPDLSLEARARGPNWIYAYLKSFYLDPSRPVGWNNTVFPNASMPNPLWELQGVQKAVYASGKQGDESHIEKLELAKDGTMTPMQYDDAVRDLVTFLTYVGEPAALKRESMGVWVILYLAAFTFLAFLLKREYWKDVH